MRKVILPWAVLIGCYVFFFAYVVASSGKLPAHVATHFDIQGRPNGWMSRDGLMEFTLIFGTAATVFVVAMMALAGKIPVSFVHLPHRDYWLAPERRRETLASLLPYGLWLASMMVLFLTGLQALVVQANTSGGGHLNGSGIWGLAGVFLLGTAIWSLLLRRKFRRLPGAR